MRQEEKDLLIVDLCGRLPYGLKVYYKTAGWEDKNYTLSPQVIDNFLIRRDVNVKPYLRPISSMTDEEEQEYSFILNDGGWGITKDLITDCIDWLNAHHFDYRGLIEKGLAIEVTKENNPYL